MSKSGNIRCESQVSIWSDASDLRLDWLFDPDRNDHLPIEKQLEFYSQRNLRDVKIYKIARRLWGNTFTRTRKIIAPPMSTKSSSADSECPPLVPPRSVTQLKPIDLTRPKDEAGTEEDTEQLQEYYQWLHRRREFREKFDKMGDIIEWLSGKPDKTALEKNVLKRTLQEKYPSKVEEEVSNLHL